MILPGRFAAMLEAGASPTMPWKHLAEPAWSKLRTCKNCSITSARTVLNTTLRRISPLWCQWFTKRRQTTWVGRCISTARNRREESRFRDFTARLTEFLAKRSINKDFMAIVAGVDFGTLSVRVTIVDTGRGRLGTGITEYPLHRKKEDPNHATQSHADHMRALGEAVQKTGTSRCLLSLVRPPLLARGCPHHGDRPPLQARRH